MFRQPILKGVLTPGQRASGLRLIEYDDHLLELLREHEHIAFFSATGARIEEIRTLADKYAGGEK